MSNDYLRARNNYLYGDNRDRQLDTLYSSSHFYDVPPDIRGRIMADDFVFFNIPKGMPKNSYQVVVEGLNTASDTYRSTGTLAETVRLPFVHLPSIGTGKIGVIPNNPNLPSFWGQLVRGNTYSIPDVKGNGSYAMKRTGVV